METLILEISNNPSDFFLNFSTKDEYLKKRQIWRDIYKWLSATIRHNKKVDKAHSKAKAKVYRRMMKKGWCLYSYRCSYDHKTGLTEYRERLKVATKDIPNQKSQYVKATDMLKIRKAMKEKSCKQRAASLYRN